MLVRWTLRERILEHALAVFTGVDLGVAGDLVLLVRAAPSVDAMEL